MLIVWSFAWYTKDCLRWKALKRKLPVWEGFLFWGVFFGTRLTYHFFRESKWLIQVLHLSSQNDLYRFYYYLSLFNCRSLPNIMWLPSTYFSAFRPCRLVSNSSNIKEFKIKYTYIVYDLFSHKKYLNLPGKERLIMNKYLLPNSNM